MRSTLPSATTMSAATRPSGSGASGAPSRSVAGIVALTSANRRSAGTDAKPFANLVLPTDGALMPAPEEEVREPAGQQEDGDTGQRQEHQRREQARNVQPVLGLDQAEGEAGIFPGGAGRELGDHRGNQSQPARDPEPG